MSDIYKGYSTYNYWLLVLNILKEDCQFPGYENVLFCYILVFSLREYGSLGQVRLLSQIWPSGQELGSQPQAPGSIPLAPLDPTSVLVGGAPSGD